MKIRRCIFTNAVKVSLLSWNTSKTVMTLRGVSREPVESTENRHIKMKLERDFEGSFGKGLTTNLSTKK